MAMMKRLLVIKEEAEQLVENINELITFVNQEDSGQLELELDDYAIPDEEATPQAVTFEAIQQFLATKAQAGYSSQIRELIQSMGANKLSELDPSNYPTLWMEVEKLG